MVLLYVYTFIFLFLTPRMAVQYRTPKFSEEIRYAGTVRFSCDGKGTVRWYGTPFL